MTLSLEQQILEAMRVAIDGEPKGPLVRPEGLTVDRSRLLEVKPTTTHVSVYPMVAGDEPIGLQAKTTLNPLDTVTTVTVQIVTLLTGDQEFDSPKTLSAFGLGLTLFVVTLGLNIIALRIVQKYREQYD